MTYDEWLRYGRKVERSDCVFYDKEPRETPYCEYYRRYLDKGCKEECRWYKTIDSIRSIVRWWEKKHERVL